MTGTTVSTKPSTPKTVKSKRGMWIAVFMAAGVTVMAIAYRFNQRHKGTAIAGDSAAAENDDRNAANSSSENAVRVPTAKLAPGGIQRSSTQIGTVEPFEQADLYAKVSGYLSTLHVDYGDRVKQGQLLATISDPEVEKDAERAEADLQQAKAAVSQAAASIESAKADREALASVVDQTKAEVDRYSSMRAYHEKKFARYNELVAKQAVPQQIADEEEESLDSAKASEIASKKAVLSARSQLLAAEARIKKSEADLEAAKANVDVEVAKLDRAKVFVSYTKVTAPYDGVITKRNFFPGAFIRSASEGGLVPLLTVARTDKLRIVTEVPDRDVPFTNVGDVAEVTLDALPGKVFKAKVSRFAETEDPTSRTMHTEIDVENPDNVIRAGMYGIAKIILDQPTKVSTLPSSCLAGEAKGGKADVYMIKEGKAKKTRIEIGVDDGIRVEIISGLKPADVVITNTQSVTDGVAVRPVEP